MAITARGNATGIKLLLLALTMDDVRYLLHAPLANTLCIPKTEFKVPGVDEVRITIAPDEAAFMAMAAPYIDENTKLTGGAAIPKWMKQS